MIEKFSLNLATALHRIGGQDRMPSIAVMRYGIHTTFNFLTTFLATVIIGLCTAKLLDMLAIYLTLAVLRAVSGGMHFKTSLHCFLFSVFAIVLAAYLETSPGFTMAFNGISVILGFIYAPAHLEGYSRIPKRLYGRLKLLYIGIALSNFIWMSDLLALCLLIQSLSLISWRKEVSQE